MLTFGIFANHILALHSIRGHMERVPGAKNGLSRLCAARRIFLQFRDFFKKAFHFTFRFWPYGKACLAGKPALSTEVGRRGLCHTFAVLRRKNLTEVRFCGLIPQVNAVGFAYGNLHKLGFIWAIKSVIPHECTYARILPAFTGSILKANGVIF